MLVYQRVIVGKHKIPWLLMAFIVLWLELVSHFLTCYFPATSIHILRNFCSARWPRVPCARCMSSWSGMARCCPLRCTSGQWTSRTAGGQVARLENKHPASSSIIQHHPASSSIIQHHPAPGLNGDIYTSSTAQGGGGSFKNRKPMGEVGCCESGMAERSHWLTERWLELCLLEWLQWLQWSPHPQLLDVVWCTATVVVVVA